MARSADALAATRVLGPHARAAALLGLVVMVAALAGARLADAQSAGDVRRIGYLSNTVLAGNGLTIPQPVLARADEIIQ
jgi:hypothetical protein